MNNVYVVVQREVADDLPVSVHNTLADAELAILDYIKAKPERYVLYDLFNSYEGEPVCSYLVVKYGADGKPLGGWGYGADDEGNAPNSRVVNFADPAQNEPSSMPGEIEDFEPTPPIRHADSGAILYRPLCSYRIAASE